MKGAFQNLGLHAKRRNTPPARFVIAFTVFAFAKLAL
jgi:hypothetical protein